jgi:MFS family permease
MTQEAVTGPSNGDGAGWMPLLITLGIQAMTAMAVLTIPAMAPRVAQAVGVSATYVGIYIALAYTGAMAASLASGAFVGRYGSIRVSQLSLLVCAAGLAISALPSVPFLVLGAALVGLGYGPITPASSHLLARTTPAHRMSLVFSIKQTGVPLGGALAGAIVPSLQLWLGWQQALLAVAAACVLVALLSQSLRRAFDGDRDASRPLRVAHIFEPVRLVLSEKPLRMLAVCSFLFSLVQLSLTTYLVTFLTGELAYGLVAAGFVLTVSQLGGVLGRVFWGYVSDRWLGARRMLVLLAGLMAACTLGTTLLAQDAPGVVLVVLFLFGASGTGWNGVYLAEVARQAPAGKAGPATGGTLFFTFLGVVLGPPFFGGISAAFGSYRAGFAALALPLAICAWALLRRR